MWSAIEPVLYWSKIFGLWSFDKPTPKNYKRNYYKHITKTIIFVIIYSIVYKAAYEGGLYTITNVTYKSGIIQFFTTFYYILIGITTVLTYTVSECFGTKLMQQMKHVDEIDLAFDGRRLLKCNKHLSKFSGITVSISFAIVIITYIIDTFTTNTNTFLELSVLFIICCSHYRYYAIYNLDCSIATAIRAFDWRSKANYSRFINGRYLSHWWGSLYGWNRLCRWST